MPIAPQDLAVSPLLASLDGRALKRLAGAVRERTYEAGKAIVTQGDGGVGFFVIVEGRADVVIGGVTRGHLGPGDWFGEVALLDDAQRRSADVVATETTRCIAMTAWEFKPFVIEHPEIAWELLRSLAKRVSDTEAFHTRAPSEAAPA